MLAVPRLPSWLVVLAALLGPIIIATLFLTAMEWANRPVPVAEYRSDPDAGYAQASLNSALLFLHALAQLAFVVAGAWWIWQRPRLRVAFLSLAIPVSGLLFLLTFIGLIAK